MLCDEDLLCHFKRYATVKVRGKALAFPRLREPRKPDAERAGEGAFATGPRTGLPFCFCFHPGEGASLDLVGHLSVSLERR